MNNLTPNQVEIFKTDVNRLFRIKRFAANYLYYREDSGKKKSILIRMHNIFSQLYLMEHNILALYNQAGPKIFINRYKENKIWSKII
jgi:hypothetical protein